MATLEIDGKIKTKLAPQEGSSARGRWIKQDFVLEYQDGNYTSEAYFTAWGQDKVEELGRFGVGDAVKVSFNVKAREYQGRWYNDLRVWKITSPRAAASHQAGGQPYPSRETAVPPPPTMEDMPTGSEPDSEDLPF